ncbi:O-antigen ligase family protein [Bosea thiooxidans]|nr:O-antigen ligase [Bosea sp. (in: a-proteobacteria)]
MSQTGSIAEAVEGAPRSAAASERLRRLALALSGFGVFILILTLQPFAAPPESTTPNAPNTGNIVNQIGYLVLGGLYLAAMLRLTPRPVLARLGLGIWLAVFAVALLSTFQALDQEASIRGLVLGAIALIVVAGVLVLPQDEADFAVAAVNACLAVLILVYGVLVFAHPLAVHGAEGAEGVHAGEWRGHLSHKNFAAPVFSMMAMMGIYGWRSGLKWRGALIVALCLIFVVNSGSKTTLGFLPIAIGLVLFGRITERPGLAVALHLLLAAMIACLTVGTVMSPQLHQIGAALIPDPTYTGRDEIWKFALSRIAERPWAGYGYASFWQTPVVTGLEENYEASWDVRGIGSGHNSYLDAMLMFGIPGAVVILWLLMVRPLRNYLAAARKPASRRLADLFAMIVIFMTYVGMLESFLLNRSDPLWILFAFAVMGLELLRRMRLKTG